MSQQKRHQADGSALLLSNEQRRRMLSSSRLKFLLTGLIGGLLIALGGLMMLLVSHIFGQLNPTIRRDLAWKAERCAGEIAVSAQLGILLTDSNLVQKTFDRYTGDTDVVSIIVADTSGRIIANHGVAPFSFEQVLSGPVEDSQEIGEHFISRADSSVEGKNVGRVGVVVSMERLAAGKRLEQRILLTLGAGCLAGLLLSLSFVAFYIVPLIRVTERAFESLRQAALDMAAKERLEKELEIGARIQTCIVPKVFEIDGLEVAARMKPAAEVGGDYYDVIPAEEGCWIGVGDVAGHGFTSGLVMLMAQSAISALVQEQPGARASQILCKANRVLFENIRHRLDQDEHLTLSLLRYFRDGRFLFSGAHEDMIVYRKSEKRCEMIPTPGTWVGAIPDISHATSDGSLQLREGDILVLYTDGVTEAMNAAHDQFGTERLVKAIEANADLPVEEILQAVLDSVTSWMSEQLDDVTVLVLRYRGRPSALAA